MPSRDAILSGLTAIANDWWWLAVTWHALLAALLLALLAGWRPSNRLLGKALVAPVICVSALAWVSGNPFNGTLFAALAACLAVASVRFARTAVRPLRVGRVAAGAALVAFGWTYPHFLNADSPWVYAYAAPFGLVPCPTLAVVIGLTLMFRDFSSALWNAALIGAGLMYAAIGIVRLGVWLDIGLLAGAIAHATVLVSDRRESAGRRARPASLPSV